MEYKRENVQKLMFEIDT